MTTFDVIQSALIGVLTGGVTSWYVSLRFSHDAHIDRALTVLKFCEPYLDQHSAGIGLKQTAHDLKAFSEVLGGRKSYSGKAAKKLLELSEEIRSTLQVKEYPPSEAAKNERDALKAGWEAQIHKLYRRLF